MNLKSGNIEQFEGYSQFESLKEFNTHIEKWMLEVKHEFSKGELVGLKRLVRFAAKIPGVCNPKIGTVLKAIQEEYQDHGISRSTFKRMINKASHLGIFTVYETERKNGSQSSNLYVFNQFPTNEPPKPEIMNHPKSSNPSKTINIENEIRSTTPLVLDSTFTNDRVPKPFVDLVKCYYDDAATIEEYWKMTKLAAYRNNFEKETERILSASIQAFKQLINKIKLSKGVKKPIAYYFGTLQNKFEALYFEDLSDMGVKLDENESRRMRWNLEEYIASMY